MKNEKQLKRITNEIRKLQAKRDAIEYRNMRQANAKYVGARFKVKNRYSSGPGWWRFIHIQTMTSTGSLEGIYFEETASGQFEFGLWIGIYLNPSDEPRVDLSRKEFEKEFTSFLSHMTAIKNQEAK